MKKSIVQRNGTYYTEPAASIRLKKKKTGGYQIVLESKIYTTKRAAMQAVGRLGDELKFGNYALEN